MAIEVAHPKLVGKHYLTAALTNVLAAQGMVNPHTGKPFSEAMILGIGGGLGAGYILWEFKSYESAVIVLGFRNRWNYPVDFLTHACQRIGFAVDVQETTSKKNALANLKNGLESGVPVLTWVDKAHLPHQQLPERMKAHISYVVGVYGLDEEAGIVQVDDIAPCLINVDLEAFTAGRARISSDKNRTMTVKMTGVVDLPAAIRAGIQDCIEHLGRDSESFALPVYKKWANLMTNASNKKGWPVVFQSRKGLYSTLRGIFEGIVLDSTDGAGLRNMYADFLTEAADALGNPTLTEAADAYRVTAARWDELANSVLSHDIPPMREATDLLIQRYALYKDCRWEAMQPLSDRVEELEQELNSNLPLGDEGVQALFATMKQHLEDIYQSENDALDILRSANV